jgi:hypothetical protein
MEGKKKNGRRNQLSVEGRNRNMRFILVYAPCIWGKWNQPLQASKHYACGYICFLIKCNTLSCSLLKLSVAKQDTANLFNAAYECSSKQEPE